MLKYFVYLDYVPFISHKTVFGAYLKHITKMLLIHTSPNACMLKLKKYCHYDGKKIMTTIICIDANHIAYPNLIQSQA